MDEFLEAAHLCEEYRLLEPAQLLRAMAGGGQVFLVAELGSEYNGRCSELVDGDGEIRHVFLDREAASRAAELGNARRFREIHLRQFGGLAVMSSLGVPELKARIGQILGKPFDLSPQRFYDDLVYFPELATDEQMIAIARLFDKMQFFHVIEAEFGG